MYRTLHIISKITRENIKSDKNMEICSLWKFVSGDAGSFQKYDDKKALVRIILLFKDQRSTNSVLRQLKELSHKIEKDIHPVYTSRKIGAVIKPKESKPPIVNQQCVVYHFKCNMYNANYVGYTCRYLYQHIHEHEGSAIGKHVRDQHGGTQVTYLVHVDSRSYGSARASLTA